VNLPFVLIFIYHAINPGIEVKGLPINKIMSQLEPMESLIMEQITEPSLKDDSEYTLKYVLPCSGWNPLEKHPKKSATHRFPYILHKLI